MSDYQYQDYGQNQYEQQQYNDYQMQAEQQQQDYQTKVQLQFFEAEQLLRKNQIQNCIEKLQELYKISEENMLKNWKIKILNLLLQIYCKQDKKQQNKINYQGKSDKIQQILMKISQLNKKQKLNQNSIKSIILTIKSLNKQSFNKNKIFVYDFINQLDSIGQVRTYLLFLQKAIQEQNLQQVQRLFQTIQKIINLNEKNLQKGKNNSIIPASNLIQLYSYKIKYSKLIKKDISEQIRRMQFKLQYLQKQSYMTQIHISIIKQSIAQILYIEDNYQDCCMYLCEAFQQNIKYGKNLLNKKNLIKINLLVALLTNNKQIYTNQKYCGLFNQLAISYKSQNDIQSLFGIVQAFNNLNINRFVQQSKMCQFNFPQPYQQIFIKVLNRLKMNKLSRIIQPYSKIKIKYLEKRLNSSSQQIKKFIIRLIADHQINGRLRNIKNSQKQEIFYFDIKQKQDQFKDIQLQNIRAISHKYM